MRKKLRVAFSLAVTAVLASMLVMTAWGAWPTGKKHAKPGRAFRNSCPRISIYGGAAANTSIYCPGIDTDDEILESWLIDTTGATGKMVSWTRHTESTYIQDADTIRDTLTTAKGIIFVLWQDVNE